MDAMKRFKTSHKVDMEFPPETTLTISSRAARVTGKLLNGLSDKYPALASPAGTISRLGQIFAGLVEVALPNSLPNLLFNYWVWLLYLIELLLFLGGKPLGLEGVSRLGGMTLGITVATHFLTYYLQAVMKKKLPFLRVVHWFIILLIILGAAALIFLLYSGMVYLGFLEPPTGAIGSWIGTIQRIAR